MSETLLKNIKTIAGQQNLSIAKLEQICGLSNGSISKWDKSNPTVGNLLKVSNALKCEIEDLLKGE